MIYFVRRSFAADENKVEHKNQLRKSVDNILKDALAEYGINYKKSQLCYNKFGKPYLKDYPDIFFNISHCHELAVCSVDSCEIGIDAENIREYSPRVAKRVCSEKELEILDNSQNKNKDFFRIWTLKESFVKAIGIGISYPMKTCEFLIENDSIISNGCDGYVFTQIILNDNFICSLCEKNDKVQKNKFYKFSRNEDLFSIKL